MWQSSLVRFAIGALLAFSTALVVAPAVMAQTTTAPIAASVADAGQPATARADAGALAISELSSQFATLHMFTYVAAVIALVLGLSVYAWNRSQYWRFATLKGAVSTVVASVLLLMLASWATLRPQDSLACDSAVLDSTSRPVRDNDEAAARARDYDLQCRAAREGAANAFGMISGFRALFMADEVPVSAGLVRSLATISTVLVCLILFFPLLPLARRLWGVKA